MILKIEAKETPSGTRGESWGLVTGPSTAGHCLRCRESPGRVLGQGHGNHLHVWRKKKKPTRRKLPMCLVCGVLPPTKGAQAVSSQSQLSPLPLTCWLVGFCIKRMQDNLQDIPSRLPSGQCETFNVIPSGKKKKRWSDMCKEE